MTLEQLYAKLTETGVPLAYGKIDDTAVPPYIVYVADGENTFYADGIAYYSATRVVIKLYTAQKDFGAEALVESAMSGISYRKTEEFYPDEKIYEITYELEV